MGNLPAARVTPEKPFAQSGLDYAGPITAKENGRRSRKTLKMYIAVFVCLATKAVHLEVVTDLTADACLAALRRFVARRGRIDTIWSDNATNFVGARNELLSLHDLFSNQTEENPVFKHIQERGIEWRFIPARAPHFGGLWEAAVKSMKRHLKVTMGNSLLTAEELHTLTAQIEAILNSRPLTPVTADPNDYKYLTPAHFLVGESLMEPAQPSLQAIELNRLSRWQYVERLRQELWSKWQQDYLQTLQTRAVWNADPNTKVDVGALVLVKDTQLPPLQWATARVKELHPGQDKIVRAVTIRFANGNESRRAMRNLCPLPITED